MKHDFMDGPAVIKQCGDVLQLQTPSGLVVAEAKLPNAGRKLAELAFEQGARSVRFEFDLKVDET